ncbi:MAG: glutathione S-transferase family protein [Gammaproteobacteria bacterium]
MTDLILHHYDFSNFSEKVRLVLGHKNLAWHGVVIPAYAPKPDYEPLTAGYRRTPALQLGADVYCDTRLICEVLDELAPAPPLYPGDDPVLTRARCETLVSWAEGALMRPVALWITGLHAERFPDAFHADRARLHGKPQPDVARVRASAAKYASQVEAQIGWIADLLRHGGDYILPEGRSLADFALYEAPWFLRTIGGAAAVPASLAPAAAWIERVRAIGHGRHAPLTATAALDAARAAEPVPLAAAGATPEGLAPGDAAVVTPFDQHSPARGRLVAADGARITLATESPRTGLVHVHFPRLGYRLSRARD